MKIRRDWKALGEALGVFVLIMLYIWWVRLYYPWVAVAVLGLVIGTHFTHGESARWLGFGWKTFRAAFPAVMPWVAMISLVLLASGLAFGTVRKTTIKQALLSMLAYAVWGLFQQYLLNGYFVNRLAEFQGKPRGHWVPITAAALFSLAHAPNWFLMPVTFAGGYICARIYLRYRSLYVLALAHGIVGFFLFLVVPDSISAHFLVGPRYLIRMYETYPEVLL
jgi:membrane protease YdiL (CAAX protease family)